MTDLLRALILPLLLVFVLAGCIKSGEPSEVPIGSVPDPTPPPEPIEFPEDQFAHDSRLEWWYHNGHLESENGREFGFHFVVFKAQDGSNESNLVAQLGVIDVESGEHYEVSRATAGLRESDSNSLEIEIADWVYRVGDTPGTHAVAATSEVVSLTLDLVSETEVMLHKEIGWIPTEIGSTYYYSWPRQTATGQLVIDGETFNVNGTSWFDQQWGDFFVLGKPAGWQWFAVQLERGGSLMITESRGTDGEVIETYGTYMTPDGVVTQLTGDVGGIKVDVLDRWTSPSTGGTYPSGWNLSVESLDLELTLMPLVLDQEVQGGLPAASTYWEGKVAVGGTQDGTLVSGNAYVELSGYVDPKPVMWRQR